MDRKRTQTDSFVVRTIVFFVGVILASIGTVAGYFCYKMANSALHIDHQWVWVTLLATLSFFMLRGAWFTVFYKPESSDKRFAIGGGNRDFYLGS